MKDLKLPTFLTPTTLLLLIAAILFVLSMMNTVFITTEQSIKGYWVLLTGWMGFLIFQFAWFANPLTLLALLLFKYKKNWAFITSSLALACLSQAFIFKDIPTSPTGDAIGIISHGVGFYYWIAAIICVFLACLIRVIDNALKKGLVNDPADIHISTLITTQKPHNTATVQTPTLSFPDKTISTHSNP